MRVLVASDRIGALPTLDAGTALARAWAARGAQVAVVAIGDAGTGFASAMAAAAGVELRLDALPDGTVIQRVSDGTDVVVAPESGSVGTGIPRSASSRPVGEAITQALRTDRPRTLYIDLALAATTHDAGAGLLAALGATSDGDLGRGLDGLAAVTRVDLEPARRLLAGIDLVGVVPAAERGRGLLGLRGLTATRGFEAGTDLEDTMAADAIVERYAAAVAAESAGHPDAGACGGAAFAVLALGGRIESGVGLCAERVRLGDTVPLCDLVVVGCDSFDFHSRGGAVVDYLAQAAAGAGVPVVVVARERLIGNREMRTFGVEAAYALDMADPTASAITAACEATARTWSW